MSDPLLTFVRERRKNNSTFIMRNIPKEFRYEIMRLGLAHHSGWTISGSEVWRINHNAVRLLNKARREEAEIRGTL